MSQVFKETKKYCERKRRKTFVTLWLTNVINHNVTQMLPHNISKAPVFLGLRHCRNKNLIDSTTTSIEIVFEEKI